MIAFLKKFFKKLWQILVRIFSFAPYVYSLEQVYEHEQTHEHETEQSHKHESNQEPAKIETPNESE